jgi:hypothetical protein
MLRYISEVALKYDLFSLHSHTPRAIYNLVAPDPKIKKTVDLQMFQPKPEVFIKFSTFPSCNHHSHYITANGVSFTFDGKTTNVPHILKAMKEGTVCF